MKFICPKCKSEFTKEEWLLSATINKNFENAIFKCLDCSEFFKGTEMIIK